MKSLIRSVLIIYATKVLKAYLSNKFDSAIEISIILIHTFEGNRKISNDIYYET